MFDDLIVLLKAKSKGNIYNPMVIFCCYTNQYLSISLEKVI